MMAMEVGERGSNKKAALQAALLSIFEVMA
jgi:hypothetical protein